MAGVVEGQRGREDETPARLSSGFKCHVWVSRAAPVGGGCTAWGGGRKIPNNPAGFVAREAESQWTQGTHPPLPGLPGSLISGLRSISAAGPVPCGSGVGSHE